MARLIDTSVIIDLERRGVSLHGLKAVLAGPPFALASITASELLAGVYRADSTPRQQRRLEYVEAVLGGITVLPFDLNVARTHARLFAELAASGRQIGPNDLIIAATALTYGYDVLTHNLRHFDRVPGLIVERPTW